MIGQRGGETALAQCDFKWKLPAAGLLALSVAGCSGMADTFKSDAGWFSKPITSVLSREDGSGTMGNKNFSLGPTGPVGPEELVNPDGSCAPAAVESPAPGSPAAPQASTAAAMPASSAADASPPVLGGIALGMTECQTVRRAGTPSNVAIGAGDNNARKVVLTYLSGTWPGVYTFESGRLKVIDEVPQAQKPARKPVAKKRAPAKRS